MILLAPFPPLAAAGLDWPLGHGAALDALRPLDGLGECSIGRGSGRGMMRIGAGRCCGEGLDG